MAEPVNYLLMKEGVRGRVIEFLIQNLFVYKGNKSTYSLMGQVKFVEDSFKKSEGTISRP